MDNIVKINFLDLRKTKQLQNNYDIYNAIKNRDIFLINKVCNKLELLRILEEINISLDKLIEECNKSDLLHKIISRSISKKSSRQGVSAEIIQLDICNKISSKYGFTITKLKNNEYRPNKDGTIVSKSDMKNKNININDCLKSFDAKITGIRNGWVIAKVVFGNGGHQDNVYTELYTICDWINKLQNNKDLYIILLDTDLRDKFNKLSLKFCNNNNLIICNHYTFQEYIIQNYSLDNK